MHSKSYCDASCHVNKRVSYRSPRRHCNQIIWSQSLMNTSDPPSFIESRVSDELFFVRRKCQTANTRDMGDRITVKQVRVRKIKTLSPRKTAIKVNFILLCVLLCAIHLILLSVDYFKFRTIALFAPFIPFEQTTPYVTICLKLPAPVGLNDKSWNSTLTVKKIDPSVVLKKCSSRNFTSKRMEPINCAHGFEVTSTIRKQSYDCYAIKPKHMTTYMILEAAAVLRNRANLYTFLLSDLFTHHKELIPLMYFRRRPENEFHFSSSVTLEESPQKISFDVDYGLIEIYRLPPPYETNCIDGSICLDREGKNHAWCTRDLCADNVTTTYITQQKTTIPGISMEVKAVASPMTRVSYAPEKRPSSFILQIFSLLGLWVNFSINVVCNPIVSFIFRARPRAAKRRVPLRRLESDINNNNINQKPKLQQTSKREMRAVIALKVLLKSAVLILFARECYIMSRKYFEFKTQVFIHIQVDEMVEYPSVSHCIDIYEWFKHEPPSRYYNVFDSSMTRFASGFNYTLKQIFELTPSVESAIDKCQVRHSWDTPLVTTSDCNGHFNVTKFFYGEFMCYFFQPRVQFIQPNDFEHDISIIYSIILGEKLIPKSHHQTIVSYSLPSQSRLLAEEQWRVEDNRQIELAFKNYKYKQLPAPYDTGCGMYEDSEPCEMECMNLTQIGLVSFSFIRTTPIDMPVIDYVDLKQKRISQFVQRAQDRCKDACPRPCDDSFTATIKQDSESNYTHQVTLLSPKYPILHFQAHPVYTIYGYLYQLACSAAFWVGLSFMKILQILSEVRRKLVSNKTSEVPFTRTMKQNYSFLSHALMLRMKSCDKKVKSRLRKIIFISSLTIGYCVHTFIMASVYFEYPSVMDTRMVYNENHTQLKTTVCISVDQLDLKGDYSLHNIWAQSPTTDQFLVECGYRGPQIPELSHLPNNLRKRIMPFVNSTSLYNTLLKVKKYSTLGLICYEVTPGESMTDTEYRAQDQILDTGVYEYFVMSPKVSSYNVTIALSQGSSINALFMVTTLYHAWPNLGCAYYYAYYVKYRITSLPPPYDMGVYDGLKRIMCMRKCLGPRMRRMKIFSPYDTAMDSSFLEHESETHSIRPESMEVKSQCESMCKYKRHFEVMNDVYFDTFTNGPHYWNQFDRPNGTISIWSLTSNYLVTETTFYPEFRFVDLVIFVGSLFLVWFGQSVLQLVDSLLTKIIGASVET